MRTLNIPAESVQTGDVVLDNLGIGLRWPVKEVTVKRDAVAIRFENNVHDERYSRSERVTVERAA